MHEFPFLQMLQNESQITNRKSIGIEEEVYCIYIKLFTQNIELHKIIETTIILELTYGLVYKYDLESFLKEIYDISVST